MKVLITGGAGFIGSHVADAYLAAGHEVVILDNLSTGKRENLPAQARLYLMDLGARELSELFAAEQPEVVNHHAAQVSVTASARNPLEDARTNVLGMLNLLEACWSLPVKKFLYASTGGAIYGDTDRLPTPENHSPQPLSPYGIHKWLGEQYLRYYAHQHGLAYTVLRYANVYGPRQNPDGEAGVVSIFFSRLLKGETPTLFAYPGEEQGMVRDYVYVQDVARANLEALDKATGQIVNIGTGVGTTTEALFRAIAQRFPGAPEPRREPARPGDLRRSLLDVRKAERLLGWKARVALSEGLDRTGESFRSR